MCTCDVGFMGHGAHREPRTERDAHSRHLPDPAWLPQTVAGGHAHKVLHGATCRAET